MKTWEETAESMGKTIEQLQNENAELKNNIKEFLEHEADDCPHVHCKIARRDLLKRRFL